MPGQQVSWVIFIGRSGSISKMHISQPNFYQLLPRQITSSIIFHGKRECRNLFLTFDDGPHEICTPAILECLKELKVQASFFILGENAVRFPEIIKQIQIDGHTIGIHGYTHHSFFFLKSAIIREQIEKTQNHLENLFGKKTSFLRPPYGRFGWNTFRIVRQQGLKIVLWDILPGDYKLNRTVSAIVDQVLKQIRGGSIIVFHDNLASSDILVKSLIQIHKQADRKGYRFVALEELTNE